MGETTDEMGQTEDEGARYERWLGGIYVGYATALEKEKIRWNQIKTDEVNLRLAGKRQK
jgi:hypothetical protein